jgi:DUF1680 family protein
VHRHLYITGGVGTEPYGEKFCEPFDLPPDRAYAETCAAIGVVMFFARRMLDLELRGAHADVMERALYNNVQRGMSLDGTKYFYVNPLEVVPAVAKRRYECHLVKTQRVPWFGCACCPPNVARLFASLGEYVASQRPDGLALHLYAGGVAQFAAGAVPVRLHVTTEYPWKERVEFSIEPATPAEFTLHLRLPGWCRTPHLSVNGSPVKVELAVGNGYVRACARTLADGRQGRAGPADAGRARCGPTCACCGAAGLVALQRGPVVYCVEEGQRRGAGRAEPAAGEPADGAPSCPTCLAGAPLSRARPAARSRAPSCIPPNPLDSRRCGSAPCRMRCGPTAAREKCAYG